jgi:opacity protein-like surface antigen
MKNMIRTLAFAAMLAGSLSTAAAAQSAAPEARSKTSGLHLGLYLNGSAMRTDVSDGDDVTDSGGGLGLHAGYGITPNASVFMRVDAASMEDDRYALAHADLGLRLSPGRSGWAIRPFVQGAVGARAAASENSDVVVRGRAFTGGAGLEYFVSRKLAIEGGLSVSFGKFSEFKDGGDWQEMGGGGIKATSRRFDLGISWHP